MKTSRDGPKGGKFAEKNAKFEFFFPKADKLGI